MQARETDRKLFIKARVSAGEHEAVCVIEDTHTGVTCLACDGQVIERREGQSRHPGAKAAHDLSVAGIFGFIRAVDAEKLAFLREAVAMNDAIAAEGLEQDCGMRVGKVLQSGRDMEAMPVSAAGSGNQGICASLPVAATARKLHAGGETMLRAQALS
ncbi:MAG: hypothetical protein ACI4O7_04470 [Aristaeellaceae bacterium]